MTRIGVDLGGTKIEAIALSDDGRELSRQRVATPTQSRAAIVEAIASLVHAMERQLALDEPASVGVGTPGAISPATGKMKNSNTQCLNGERLDSALSEALGREIRLANDANCFALSEAVDGAGAGAQVVFGVIIGTGTGGGVVVDRKVLTGLNAVAGEWGHNPLPWPDTGDEATACYCGKHGCIETFLSGPALARDHQRVSGEELTAVDVAARAARGDAAAVATLARYVRRLGKALAVVVNLLDPHVIVLGGGLSNIDALYAAVQAPLAEHAFSDTVVTPVVKAKHGDSSGVRGAAWLW